MKIKALKVFKLSAEKCPGISLIDLQQSTTIVNTCRNTLGIVEL